MLYFVRKKDGCGNVEYLDKRTRSKKDPTFSEYVNSRMAYRSYDYAFTRVVHLRFEKPDFDFDVLEISEQDFFRYKYGVIKWGLKLWKKFWEMCL